MEKPSSRGDIQASFPFPCTLQGRREVAERRTDLHVGVKTYLCLLLPIPILQNAHVFPVAKLASLPNLLSASCASCAGVWKEWGHGRASASLPGMELGHTISCSTDRKSLLLMEEKRYFPWWCNVGGMLIHIELIRKLGVYLVAEIERNFFT